MVYTGTWLVLATLAIIVTLFWLGYYWARTHGLLDDVDVKQLKAWEAAFQDYMKAHKPEIGEQICRPLASSQARREIQRRPRLCRCSTR